MHFYGNVVADTEFVYIGASCHDGSHVFVAYGKTLVKRQLSFHLGGKPLLQDLQVRPADGYRLDADKHFCGARLGNGLLHQPKLPRSL